MPPKKKGKGNKLARMSEEEKLRYLQHRAAIEEEARRRKEHIIATFMKNKLKHEEAFTRLNTAKINQQWRATLRQIKCKELHDATETLRQVFEIALKTKNKIIENFENDLLDCEKDHSLAVQTHMVAVDKFFDIQSIRLSSLSESRGQLEEGKLNRAKKERQRFESNYEKDEKHLKTVIHWEKMCNQRNQSELEALGKKHRDELLHQLMAEMRQSEIRGDKEINEIKQEMKKTVEEYRRKFEPFEAQYNQLMASDKTETANYYKNCELITRYEETIAKLKIDVKKVVKEKTEDVNMLQDKLNEKKREFKELKRRLEELNKMDLRLIKTLSKTCNTSIKNLKGMEAETDQILHYMEATKKLGDDDLVVVQHLDNVVLNQAEGEEEVPLLEASPMWRKIGRARVELVTAEAIHANLTRENHYLQQLLRQYLNTVSRPSSVPSLARKVPKLRPKSHASCP